MYNTYTKNLIKYITLATTSIKYSYILINLFAALVIILYKS